MIPIQEEGIAQGAEKARALQVHPQSSHEILAAQGSGYEYLIWFLNDLVFE
jgi:hypothetical protein